MTKSTDEPKPVNPKDGIGVKKVPLWLCSAVAKAHWAVAQLAGKIKYGAWNWRAAGVRASVYISAIERHVDKYKSGEELDSIDKTRHLGNIMACCAIIMDAEAAGKLIDDRGPRLDLTDTYTEVELTMAHLIETYKDYLPGGSKTPKDWTINDEIPA